MPIYTALGPIEAADLGPTSMHEHVFVDSRVWLEPSHERNAPPPTAPVSIETLGFLRWNPHSLEDNLIVDDPEVCVHELRRVAAAGGPGIVDMTNIGLGRRPADLPDVARRSGVHIMVGCGFYVHDSHPDWVEAASDGELEAIMIRDLVDGIDGTGLRAALIGEIGTSSPVTDREERVVRAAGRAGARTGAMVNIHLDARGAHALEILEMLTDGGQPAGRVASAIWTSGWTSGTTARSPRPELFSSTTRSGRSSISRTSRIRPTRSGSSPSRSFSARVSPTRSCSAAMRGSRRWRRPTADGHRAPLSPRRTGARVAARHRQGGDRPDARPQPAQAARPPACGIRRGVARPRRLIRSASGGPVRTSERTNA